MPDCANISVFVFLEPVMSAYGQVEQFLNLKCLPKNREWEAQSCNKSVG